MSQTVTAYDPEAFLRGLLMPMARPRTYLRIVHLFLGLPLGVAYLCFVTTMLALGFALSVTVFGLPLVGLVLEWSRKLTAFDLWLAERLLGRRLPRPSGEPVRGRTVLGTAIARIRNRGLWSCVGYLVLRCPLGALDFAVAAAMLGAAAWGMGNWVLVAAGVDWCFGLPVIAGHGLGISEWEVDTVGKALLFAVPGLAILLVTPCVLNAMAALSQATIERLVGRVSYRELRGMVLGALAGGRELDGPAIMAELRLFYGVSVDFTGANVYAVLRSLAEAGLASVRTGEMNDRYALTQAGEAATGEA